MPHYNEWQITLVPKPCVQMPYNLLITLDPRTMCLLNSQPSSVRLKKFDPQLCHQSTMWHCMPLSAHLVGMERVHICIVLASGIGGVGEEICEEVSIHVTGIGLYPYVNGEWTHGGCNDTQ